MTEIHPTATVHPGARIGEGVVVGPYAVIEDKTVISDGCRIGPHVVLRSFVEMGEGNDVGSFTSLGDKPQHLGYKGEETRLVIGRRNIIREYVTLNRGTAEGGGVTTLGDDCMIMAYAHAGHDCRIGNGVVIVNAVQLAGHVTVEDFAVIGGLTAIHQHVRIGAHAMVGGASALNMDAPPFTMVAGYRASLRSLNLVGLRRRGFPKETIAALKTAYRIIFRDGLVWKDAREKVRAEVTGVPEVDYLVAFIDSSKRGVIRRSAKDGDERS